MFDRLVSPKRFHFALFAAFLLALTVLVGPSPAEDRTVSKPMSKAAVDDPAIIKTESSEIGDKAVLKDGKLVREVDPATLQLAQTQALPRTCS